MITVHTDYSDILNLTIRNYFQGMRSRRRDSDIVKHIFHLKYHTKNIFEYTFDNGFSTLKFHIIDLLCTDIHEFGQLSILNSTPYEHYQIFK